MIRGLRNKKGDVTITTVILIVLGLVVLVLLILGFTRGTDFFFGIFDRAPSELQTLASACAVYAKGSLRIDFCSYNLVGKELVNCRDPRIIDSLESEGIDTKLPSLNCESIDIFSFKKDACERLAFGKPDTKMGNVTSGVIVAQPNPGQIGPNPA